MYGVYVCGIWFSGKVDETRKQMLLFVFYCPGPLAVIYNMYKSMTY